jgi:D-serine deaminase-like pyridoxal phosphate-dependent protein
MQGGGLFTHADFDEGDGRFLALQILDASWHYERAAVSATEVEQLASEIDEAAGALRGLGIALYPDHFQHHAKPKLPHSGAR